MVHEVPGGDILGMRKRQPRRTRRTGGETHMVEEGFRTRHVGLTPDELDQGKMREVEVDTYSFPRLESYNVPRSTAQPGASVNSKNYSRPPLT